MNWRRRATAWRIPSENFWSICRRAIRHRWTYRTPRDDSAWSGCIRTMAPLRWADKSQAASSNPSPCPLAGRQCCISAKNDRSFTVASRCDPSRDRAASETSGCTGAFMKAAVWHGRQDVRIEKVIEPPAPPPGQVQVKVAWCGICGTDLHEYMGGPLYIPLDRPHPVTGVQAPVIIGHEMSGEVTAVGDGVDDFAVGDRIAACPIIGCGKCRWCRTGSMAQCDRVAFLGTSWTGGALAERLNLNAYQCYHLTDAIGDEIGALVEPFSATVRAVAQGEPGPDDSVAIVGTGPIGLMALMAARLRAV